MPGLFDRFDLNGLPLPNRMVMAPMTRTRADDDRVPTPLMAQYYAQRASAGLIVTECTAVRADSAGIVHSPGMYSHAQVEGWRRVTEAVHRAAGRIYLQLWHCGRISHQTLQPGGEDPVGPSAVAATGEIFTPEGRRPFPVPRALDLAEIAPIVEAFGAAAGRAREAGFDGMELHGAFGYLVDQFLQDASNRRTDAYGGSVANRSRFLIEVVEAMAGAWEPGRVGVKLSPSSRLYGARDSDAATLYGHVVGALDGLGVGYVHLMEPDDGDLKTGTVQIEHVTQALRPLFRGNVVTNGGYDRPRAEAVLAAGTADLVSFGTPFIANPDLVERYRLGAPLATPDRSLFYGEGPKGYTDYPADVVVSGEFPVLYSMPETCAVAVLIAVKWARADHELVVLGHGANHEPAFLAINPSGQVPAMTAEGEPVMTETHALLLLLADSHPESGLAPPSARPVERYRLEQLLAFMTGEVHAAFAPVFRPERHCGDAADADAVRRAASAWIGPMLARLDASLGLHPFLLGVRSVADAFLYVITRWARSLPGDLDAVPNLARFRAEMEADPGVQAALADHGMKPLGKARRSWPATERTP